MKQKCILVLFCLIAAAQTVFCWESAVISSDHRIMLRENRIWIEDAGWNTIADNPQLYLEDSNPIFFASVFNTMKENVLLNKTGESTQIVIWYESYYSPVRSETYNIIRQIQAQ